MEGFQPDKESKCARRLRRSRSRAGSAIVEGAFVFLPMMALLFAMLDFPLAIFIQNTLREAVREGVRFAITQQTGPNGQDAAIQAVVEGYSMGFLTDAALVASPPTETFTITYYDGQTLNAVTGIGSNAGGNICVVTASINHTWMAPVWQSIQLINLTGSSSDVMEPPPGGVIPAR
jgi:Flp pilus assembly protein TadG